MCLFARDVFARGDADDAAEDTRKILRRDADGIGDGRYGHIGGKQGAGSTHTDGGEVCVWRASRLLGKEGGKIGTVKPYRRRDAGDGKRLVILGFHDTDCLIYMGAVISYRTLTKECPKDAVYMCRATVFGTAVGIVTHGIEVGYCRTDFGKCGIRNTRIFGGNSRGGERIADIATHDGTPETGTRVDRVGDEGDAFTRHKDIAVANGDGDFTLCLNNRAAAVDTALEDIMIVDDGTVAGAAGDVLILINKDETGFIICFHKCSIQQIDDFFKHIVVDIFKNICYNFYSIGMFQGKTAVFSPLRYHYIIFFGGME